MKQTEEIDKTKQRLITAMVGIVLLLVVIYLYHSPVLTVALALLSGIAVYEVLVTGKFITSKTGGYLCVLFAGLSIFIMEKSMNAYFLTLIFFVAVLMISMLLFHEIFSFSSLSVCVFTATVLPLTFSTIMRMRDLENGGLIYLILICIAAWVTDSGAYFAGKAFGKHKMVPKLSPNKTIEGAIGGLIVTGIVFPLICLGYWKYYLVDVEFSFFNAICIGVICAFFGVLGDLFASAIKRQAGIKDFGKIMPGHGGIMDRFDSFLFVAPLLYLLIQIYPIFY